MHRPEDTERLREGAELREYVLGDFEKPVTPEQAKRLDQELADTAAFFEAGGIDFYVAGGSGLDLLDGEWKRDHQDLDAAIPGKDRLKLYEMAEREGFVVKDHQGEPLSKEAIADEDRHNCFLFRKKDGVEERFEAMFLPDGDDAAYENAPTVERAGHEIRLQPPEIILFHKLMDGRRKDFRDIRKVWPKLDDARKADVQRRVDEAGIRFKIGPREEASVEALLAAAPEVQKEMDAAFFEGDAARMKDALEGELRKTASEVYALRHESASRAEFMKRLAEKYGSDSGRAKVMEQMGDFLFHDPAPDEESFTAWARMAIGGAMDERLKAKASYEFKEEKLWTI